MTLQHINRLARYSAVALTMAALVTGCSNPALRQAEEFRRNNQLPQAWTVLDAAARQTPDDKDLHAARLRVREQLVPQLVMQIEGLRTAGRWDAASDLLQRLRDVEARNPRIETLEQGIARGRRHEALIQEARTLQRAGKLEDAEAKARLTLAENPSHPQARALLAQLAQARPLEQPLVEMGAGFQKQVNLEFREAPLRQVFETLARSSNINFVFDKDVRTDGKVTVFLRGVTLDEAIRVILATQQLDRKLLNESSVLIFPATAAKQREHQELISRTLYLTNADVKQVQALLKTIAKVRDIHVDERLNLLVVRDTPEVMRLVEKLIASVDLPEPEVMLEVEVMELSTDRVEALGLQWPDSVQFGLPGVAAGELVPISQLEQFRGSIVNPAVLATLRGTSGNTNMLANPKIRVRNRDKALIHIGEKLPVFTSTTAANIGVSSNVTYLDIGLKLEVEPAVQLDNDVTIKVAMEVSNLIRQVAGPAGAVAYEIGTRKANTSLRLADGETQVLAGLINDEDRRSSVGIPGLSRLPVLGKLFGTQSDTRNKTEVVLLITPRIVRNLTLPEAGLSQLAAGTDASPGAFSTRMASSPSASAGQVSNAAGSRNSVAPAANTIAAPTAVTPPAASVAKAAADTKDAVLVLDVTPQIPAGGTFSVTLKNASGAAIKGELEFDAGKAAVMGGGSGTTPGRLPFELAVRGERVVLLRALQAAAGQVLRIGVSGPSATNTAGESVTVKIEGTGQVAVEAAR